MPGDSARWAGCSDSIFRVGQLPLSSVCLLSVRSKGAWTGHKLEVARLRCGVILPSCESL
jgi:hypothetical protein